MKKINLLPFIFYLLFNQYSHATHDKFLYIVSSTIPNQISLRNGFKANTYNSINLYSHALQNDYMNIRPNAHFGFISLSAIENNIDRIMLRLRRLIGYLDVNDGPESVFIYRVYPSYNIFHIPSVLEYYTPRYANAFNDYAAMGHIPFNQIHGWYAIRISVHSGERTISRYTTNQSFLSIVYQNNSIAPPQHAYPMAFPPNHTAWSESPWNNYSFETCTPHANTFTKRSLNNETTCNDKMHSYYQSKRQQYKNQSAIKTSTNMLINNLIFQPKNF